MTPEMTAALIISAKDLIISMCKPEGEVTPEWEAAVHEALQKRADEGEDWLTSTLGVG